MIIRRCLLFVLPICCLITLLSIDKKRSEAAEVNAAKTVEAERIKIINKVKPSVVAVFARGGGGGGSGVLIDAEGYALTNYHVVAPAGPIMACGLPDGVLYDAVLVGQDKVGDVALIKLFPKKEGDKFPFAEMGNSDEAKAGEWCLAMGNPFLLATDFTPSVSFGLISGVNRYQYPEGGFLEYTDCIQFDTTINPGNSGGPLFNMKGQLIGINGRGSFAQDKRFRINCGVGYAISINQIKNFLGHLHAGLDADHATLGARVESPNEESDLSRMVVREILEDSDAARRGLQEMDELVSFAGRSVNTVNQFKNVLGIFPKDWRVPLVYRRGERERKEVLVRLQPWQQSALAPKNPEPKQPRPKKDPTPKMETSPVSKYYKERRGFANYYYNEVAQKRVWESLKKLGDYSSVGGNWQLDGTFDMEGRGGLFTINIRQEAEKEAKAPRPIISIKTNTEYRLEPLKRGQSDNDLAEPPKSGGLLMAMYHYHRFLTQGAKGFEGNNFTHGGVEPFYPHPLDGSKVKSYRDIRVMAEVIRTEHADISTKWYFYRKDLNPEIKSDPVPDGAMIGFEVFISKEMDPCEVYLSEYKSVGGRSFPHKMDVRHSDYRYAVFTLKDMKTEETPK